MKKTCRRYEGIDRERKIFAAVMAAVAVALLVLFVMELCGALDPVIWKPSAEYPMANANIGWQQSFYPGGFT